MKKKLEYEKPELNIHGSIKDITNGPETGQADGIGESPW